MDSASGSTALATTYGATQQQYGEPAALGPALFEGMGESALVAALNAWGGGMHREVLSLRADLGATQVHVSNAFEQAQDAVRELVTAFRVEVVAMRQQSAYEAQQSLERLVQVVDEARARFGEQDTRFSSNLGELAQRLQAADAWAQAEPARVAAIVHAAPAPPWLSAAHPITPPRAAPLGAPGSPHLVLGPALSASPAWDAYAAGRAAQGPPPPDAWAQRQQPQQQAPPTQQTQQQPQQPQPTQYNIASPPGFGNFGGAGGGFSGKNGHPQELRIIARDWGTAASSMSP